MLTREEWARRAAAHRREAEAELADVVHRRDRGLAHPVEDFLFSYYNTRPSQLMQWHPGVGTAVEDDGTWRPPMYRITDGTAQLDAAHFLAKRGNTVARAGRLLRATLNREPNFGCFGMHEWAMVYRLRDDETRHPYLPLRFPPDELAAIVESNGCRCTHFDAFRFFTEPAKPLNIITPTRGRQLGLDQPGCLHVNMDLYRTAGKLWPAVPSSLLLSTFLLAREIREVDMRASAYDLTAWGYEPIRVETPAGRAEYVRFQRRFAERAEPLRRRLLGVVDALGEAAPKNRESLAT